MKFEFNQFIRGHLRHYLSWAALAFLPWMVTKNPDWDGILLIFTGATLRAYASGFLDKEGRLSIAGPFSFVRNPLYLGTLLMACGVAQSQDAWVAFSIVLLVGFALLFFVVRAEEGVLSEKFPNAYPLYLRDVPRFIPRLKPFSSRETLKNSAETRVQRFSVELFRRNRGYEALLAGGGLPLLLFLVHGLLTLVRGAVASSGGQ